MNLAETILEKVQALPAERQQEVLDFLEFLAKRYGSSQPRRSLEGLWADLNIQITDDDIAEARREMWGEFPRKDIV